MSFLFSAMSPETFENIYRHNSFTLFGADIAWYGVILTTAMVIAFFLFLYLGKRDNLEVDFSMTMFLFAIIFAVVGARLIYVIPRADEYFTSWEGFLNALSPKGGGLSIIGGIPCGALGIYLACKIYKKSVFRVFDMVIPCLLLGQILGRWGNFVNGELFGFAITNPDYQVFPIAVWVYCSDCGGYGWHAANFFYEMMLNLIGFIIAMVVMFTIKDKLKVGTISVAYVIWYCLVRGCLEFVKVGQMTWGPFRAIQLICFLVIPIAVVVLVLIQKGIIKLETEKMYELHYKVVHEPPPYDESSDNSDN